MPQSLPFKNSDPADTEYGVLVRLIGAAGGGGAIPITTPVYTAYGVVVPYSAVDVIALAAVGSRVGFSLMNLTDRVVYIKIGGVASATDCMFAVQPNQLYESQPWMRTTAAIHVIGAAGGSGNYMLTWYRL